MRNRFASLGNELKRTLSVIGDLIILNVLFILCSIPVITVGAAGAACYSGIYRIFRTERTGLPFVPFFKDFVANFKKATVSWIIELICFVIIWGDFWFAIYYSQPHNDLFLILAIVLAAVVMLGSVWIYPLVARFENKLGAQIKNSFLMAAAQFPRTLLALLVQAVFLSVPMAFVFVPFQPILDIVAYLGWFWALFGASLPMYLTAKLFKSALRLERVDAETDSDK